MGTRYGIPTLAVTAVGKDMARDAKYFRLATRICAELGAHYIKTYYVEDGLRDRHLLLSGSDRDRGRQEDSGAGCPEDGPGRHSAGRQRRFGE